MDRTVGECGRRRPDCRVFAAILCFLLTASSRGWCEGAERGRLLEGPPGGEVFYDWNGGIGWSEYREKDTVGGLITSEDSPAVGWHPEQLGPTAHHGPDRITARVYVRISGRFLHLTKEKIELLRGIKGLEALDLSYNHLSQDAIATVGELIDLKALILSGTDLSDATIGALRRLKKLEVLHIEDNAQLSVKGLAQLDTLPKLRLVRAGNTSVTAKDIPSLRRVLADCTIDVRARLVIVNHPIIRGKQED
ncbi:MAG: hypothetical protein H8E44_28855 [Planctomycetes bacterium]|nr:hypothetical protein [Planctomycetota bacterium]MBL7038582.1 hypothetical protein [Pirellulaceae bacterium]